MTATQFDEKKHRFLMLLPSEEPHHGCAEAYAAWFAQWQEQLDTAVVEGRFGVILDNRSPHKHEPHQRDEADENRATAIITAFRREQRARVNALTTGYASVYDGPLTAAQWEKAQARTAQFAAYTFGLRGRMFKDVASAKAWLTELAEYPPLSLDEVGLEADKTTSTATFYGSTTGTTEIIAEKIQASWQALYGETLPIINVSNMGEWPTLSSYNRLLVGSPTWNIGKLQDDWEMMLPHLHKFDLRGKKIAMFGVGDQYGYPENFQDALGILGQNLLERGATLVGYTSTAGYEHSYSRAETDEGQFMGLALDEVNQPELTDERIRHWIIQVQAEFQEQKMVSVAS